MIVIEPDGAFHRTFCSYATGTILFITLLCARPFSLVDSGIFLITFVPHQLVDIWLLFIYVIYTYYHSPLLPRCHETSVLIYRTLWVGCLF